MYLGFDLLLAAIVRLHGTSPWHRCFCWYPRKDLNLQPLVCRTSAPSVVLLGQKMHGLVPWHLLYIWRSELESNQPFGLFRPALIRLSYPTVWSARRDSNSRILDLQSSALATWRRAQIGTEGEIRTLESSLEDSHVSSYITSADAGRAARAGAGVRSLELLAGLGPAASTFEASRSSI